MRVHERKTFADLDEETSRDQYFLVKKVADLFEETQAESMQDASDWLDKNQLARKDEFDATQEKKNGKEVDGDVMDWVEAEKESREGKQTKKSAGWVSSFSQDGWVLDDHDGGGAERQSQ